MKANSTFKSEPMRFRAGRTVARETSPVEFLATQITRTIPMVKCLPLANSGLKLIERPVQYCFVQHLTSQFLLVRWTEHG